MISGGRSRLSLAGAVLVVVAGCRGADAGKAARASASAVIPAASTARAASPLVPAVTPEQRPEPKAPEPWVVPKLPKAELSWHLVSRSDSALDIDPLENAAVVRPSLNRISSDVAILKDGRAQLVPGLFRGLEVGKGQMAQPVEGAWPEPLLLTVATTTRAREGRVLWRQQGAFVPLTGELASRTWFLLLPSRNGSRQLLVTDNDAYPVFELPGGKRADVQVESTVDGKPFRVEAAVVQGERLLVAGIVAHIDPHEAPRGGGGPPDGPVVVQRFEGAGSKPVIDRMPEPASRSRAIGHMVRAGSSVFLAIHGSGNYFARYDGKSWHSEQLPVDGGCNGMRLLTGATDGSVFFSPYCATEGVDAYRRDPSGKYSTIAFPRHVENCDMYAESVDSLWLACAVEDEPGGKLFFTRAAPGPTMMLHAGTSD